MAEIDERKGNAEKENSNFNVLEECAKAMLPNTKATRLKTFCQTRWVERHEAVFLFKEFFAAILATLERISETHSTESARRASSLHNSMCNFSFILSMVVLEKMLSYTYKMSQFLQSKEIDLSNAMTQIHLLISTLCSDRENDDFFHNEIYAKVMVIAQSINVDEKVPRTCGTQRNRSNVSYSTPEQYYKRTVYIPYSDFLITSLRDRFLQHEESIVGLQNLMPKYLQTSTFESIMSAVTFYSNDLSGHVIVIEAEFNMWKRKWAETDPEKYPKTAVDALAVCDRTLFANIYILLNILTIIPVSTASVERTFSTLRLIKSYLRNSMAESRLNGLALMSIHRQIDVTDEEVLDAFTVNKRRLDLGHS